MTPEILSLLEFDKLKEIASTFSFSVLGREGIEALVPVLEKVKRKEKVALVAEFRRLLNSTQPFPASHDRDPRPLIAKLRDGAYHLTIPELVSMADICREFSDVGRFIAKHGGERIQQFRNNLTKLPALDVEVRRIIDENGDVKDSATKELKAIRNGFRQLHKTLIRSAERLVSGKKRYLQEELFTTREERIVLPVLLSERKQVPGIVHGMSQSQNTIFIEPMELIELNNEYTTYRIREAQEIKRILRNLTEIIIKDLDTFLGAIEDMKIVDTLYGIAAFSDHYGFAEPAFSNGSEISIRGGRHPLLIIKKGKDQVVAFDVQLSGEQNLLLVSGPNMGGKTVLLKSIGIITVMAYAGMPIPAQSDSVIPEINSIYADIGDEQSIEMDLSTFSSHIRHISKALQSADQHSLVLLDEVGVGTDPEEGMGIAMAALEKLAEKGALIFASTHYGKLKHFVAGNERMQNASMEFDFAAGIPTYRLSVGVPGSSHGFAIAKKEGFPHELLKKARSYLDENAVKTEDLVVTLEKLRREAEILKEGAAQSKERYETLKSEYEEKYGEFKRKEAELMKDARHRAEHMVIETRREMERIIREIRESQASRISIKDSKSRIERKLSEFSEEKESVHGDSFSVGDFVYSNKLKLTGEIVEILENYAKVETENVRFLAPLDSLEIREKSSAQSGEVDADIPSASSELDIRGLLVDEAKNVVLRFIDNAVLSSLESVRIIHGKGTGALREAVEEMLKKDRRIEGLRLGYWNEGGSGVTIVTIRR